MARCFCYCWCYRGPRLDKKCRCARAHQLITAHTPDSRRSLTLLLLYTYLYLYPSHVTTDSRHVVPFLSLASLFLFSLPPVVRAILMWCTVTRCAYTYILNCSQQQFSPLLCFLFLYSIHEMHDSTSRARPTIKYRLGRYLAPLVLAHVSFLSFSLQWGKFGSRYRYT